MPINDDGTPGSEQGQAGAIMKKLSALVNQIAVTKNRHIIAELNREVDSLTAKLRTMTVGAHCLACGKAHCHVNARDAAQLLAETASLRLQRPRSSWVSMPQKLW